MAENAYGRTPSGKLLTEEWWGRCRIGAATVESVRLDPELSQALRERAEQEGRTNSELLRLALRRYLEAG